jgi:hypothetical protein
MAEILKVGLRKPWGFGRAVGDPGGERENDHKEVSEYRVSGSPV